MKRAFVLVFVLLFSVSLVCAADEWGDINTGNKTTPQVSIENTPDIVDDVVPVLYEDDFSVGDSKYTSNFYIALGIGVAALIILAFLVWFFLRAPSNKFNGNRKVVKK